MKYIDVQLTHGGAQIEFGTRVAELFSDEFDVLAEKVAEAALNKRGMEYVSALVSEAQIGWFYGELEITNVRPQHLAEGLTAVNFAAGPGFLLIESGLILRFTRPIQ